jgi:UDP-glucuronate 4-epimerase
MRILITGAAGFIGFHTAARLLDRGDEVVGLDNMSPYLRCLLKEARLSGSRAQRISFHQGDLAEREVVEAVFAEERPERVIHLAAQAGVRYSLNHPHAYIDANVAGTLHVLEGCRHTASSISSTPLQARSMAPTASCPSA